jgi:hypothetical protein
MSQLLKEEVRYLKEKIDQLLETVEKKGKVDFKICCLVFFAIK